MRARELCIDFIPILIVYFFISDPKSAVLFSGSTLGKLISICIIAFYTSVNMVYGVFVCLLILVYYQTDFVEEILNAGQNDWMETQLNEMNASFTNSLYVRESPNTYYGGGEPAWGNANGKTTIAEISLPKPIIQISGFTPEKNVEGFASNDPSKYAYEPVKSYRSVAEDFLENKDKKAELMAIFRKEHCKNGTLTHRGLEVNSEMSDHIFREIKYDNEYNKCNPCNVSCEFSIIEEKIQTESELQTPVRSNDVFTRIFQNDSGDNSVLKSLNIFDNLDVSGYFPSETISQFNTENYLKLPSGAFSFSPFG